MERNARVAVQHGLKGFFSRLRDHGLSSSFQPRPCGRRSTGRCPVQEGVPLRAELQRAWKILGKKNWGRLCIRVPLGEKRSEEVAVPMKTENLSHFLWGCRPWFSIRERSPFAYCFIVAFWESRVQGNQSAFQCMKEQLVLINCGQKWPVRLRPHREPCEQGIR